MATLVPPANPDVGSRDAAPQDRPKPLMGKHVLELRVTSGVLPLAKAIGTLRIEPDQGPPILQSLQYENPRSVDPLPADAVRRPLKLEPGGPPVDLLVFRPPTEFGRMIRRMDGRSAAPESAGPGYFFADLLFDRPDPRFKGLLRLDVDGQVHSAEFDYPPAEGGREAK